jgi:hypothetical protein
LKKWGNWILTGGLSTGYYSLAEFFSYLAGDPKYAFGYAKYALQRDQARKILGNDPRKFHKNSMRKSIRRQLSQR